MRVKHGAESAHDGVRPSTGVPRLRMISANTSQQKPLYVECAPVFRILPPDLPSVFDGLWEILDKIHALDPHERHDETEPFFVVSKIIDQRLLGNKASRHEHMDIH